MFVRERHKAIAIPVSYINDIPHFLVVHDRRYKEWTFVTGGCRRREIYNPLRCAVRELEEETRGLINLKRGSYTSFKFITNTQESRDVEDGSSAINYYQVYLFDLPMTCIDHNRLIKRFTEEKIKMDESKIPFRRNYDENDDLKFETIETISNKSNLWPMIRKHVLNNQAFLDALTTTRRTLFNLTASNYV
jgi:hypothetical protein